MHHQRVHFKRGRITQTMHTLYCGRLQSTRNLPSLIEGAGITENGEIMRVRVVRPDFSSLVIEPIQESLFKALESCLSLPDGMAILKERAVANQFSFWWTRTSAS